MDKLSSYYNWSKGFKGEKREKKNKGKPIKPPLILIIEADKNTLKKLKVIFNQFRFQLTYRESLNEAFSYFQLPEYKNSKKQVILIVSTSANNFSQELLTKLIEEYDIFFQKLCLIADSQMNKRDLNDRIKIRLNYVIRKPVTKDAIKLFMIHHIDDWKEDKNTLNSMGISDSDFKDYLKKWKNENLR